MKKLFKSLLILSTPLVVAPVILSLSSCVNPFSGEVRVYENVSSYTTKTRYGDLAYSSASLKQIIYGSKKFYTGNYVLAFGSSGFKQTIQFLFSNQPGAQTDIYANAELNYSPFVNGIKYYADEHPTDIEKKEIGFASYVECQPIKDIEEDKFALPFEKWTKTDENEDEKHKEGEFKREDKSAKTFREFIGDLKILFGEENFKEEDLSDACWVIYWKDGIPQKIEKNINKDSFTKTLKEVYENKKPE